LEHELTFAEASFHYRTGYYWNDQHPLLAVFEVFAGIAIPSTQKGSTDATASSKGF